MIQHLQRWEKILFRMLVSLVSLLLFALLILVTAQIISRQFGIRALSPPDEIVTLIFAWMVFLGSALLVRDSGHLRVEVIDLLFTKHPHWRKYYNLVISLLVLIFLAALTQSGLRIVSITGSKTSPMLAWPQRMWYLSLPVSSILMLVYLVVRTASEWFGKSKQIQDV